MGLEDDLTQRYPLALADMRTDAPEAAWWFECAEGWRPIILELLERLEAEIAAQPAAERDAFRVVQVKEKFGTLRVYLAGQGTERMEAAIHSAEQASSKTCEVCGAPGELRSRNRWMLTRCQKHFET